MKRLFKIGCIGIVCLAGLVALIGVLAGDSEESGEVRESTPSVNPVSINPTAHGVENLPETLPHNVTLETEGPSTELPCFASVTVGEPPDQDRIERYQEFTEAGSYRITATVGGKKVWEFSTQYCKPWSISGDSS